MPAIQTKMRKRLQRRVREHLRQTLTEPEPEEKPSTPKALLRVEDFFEFALHPGQEQAWCSTKRFVCIIAGTQSGKTSFGPYWLLREIQRCGAGDYLAVAPTLKLLSKKLLPELKRLFVRRAGLFVYKAAEGVFELTGEGELKLFGTLQNEPTRLLIGHAADADALESMTARAALLDECGQRRFRLAAWEAIVRRLSLAEGRALLTTTPYNLGWLKRKLYDAWRAAPEREAHSGTFIDSEGKLRHFSFEQHDHDEIDVVRFESIMNPRFPVAEFDRARHRLPAWKFAVFYRGLFTRPAGLIYDCFNESKQALARFDIPEAWPRYLGLDFGPVNTAGVFIAHDKAEDRFVVYQAYKAGGRSSEGHVKALRALDRLPIRRARGGSRTEQGWRDAYRQAGLKVQEPKIKGVDEGIDHVYALIKAGRLVVFDDLEGVLEEILTYARELDENDEPTDKIADKSKFHLMDALRYGLGGLGAAPGRHYVSTASHRTIHDDLEDY